MADAYAFGGIVSPALVRKTTNVNINYTVQDSDGTVLVDTTSGDVTITIPHIPDRIIAIKKTSTDTNKLIIKGLTGTVEGQATFVTASTIKPVYHLVSDSTNLWFATGWAETTAAIETNQMIPAPRFRMNRTATLTLSTSWQRVDLSGTSAYNINTFPIGPDGVNPMVYWDATNKLFKFQATTDRNYDYSIYPKTSAATLISALNLTMGVIRFRLVIPAPTPIYFPFPDSVGYGDLGPVNTVSPLTSPYNDLFYANPAMRQYGLGVEMALSNTVLGGVTLDEVQFIIYGR